MAEGEAPVVLGPAVRNNITPLNDAYACYANKLAQNNVRISIGVSDIRDYTGKASDLEGTVVTQGGPMMAYSALGKLKPAVELHERFDTRVAELELAYIDRRQLGTGQPQVVNGQQVPWIPYYGGTIIESDYYLVGGITEVNYNIQSGGFSGSVDLIVSRFGVMFFDDPTQAFANLRRAAAPGGNPARDEDWTGDARKRPRREVKQKSHAAVSPPTERGLNVPGNDEHLQPCRNAGDVQSDPHLDREPGENPLLVLWRDQEA